MRVGLLRVLFVGEGYFVVEVNTECVEDLQDWFICFKWKYTQVKFGVDGHEQRFEEWFGIVCVAWFCCFVE